MRASVAFILRYGAIRHSSSVWCTVRRRGAEGVTDGAKMHSDARREVALGFRIRWAECGVCCAADGPVTEVVLNNATEHVVGVDKPRGLMSTDRAD